VALAASRAIAVAPPAAALWAQSLRVAGPVTPLNTSKLVASAVTQPLAPGFDPFDVGAGVVRAPPG
jgi:hypothetical protein